MTPDNFRRAFKQLVGIAPIGTLFSNVWNAPSSFWLSRPYPSLRSHMPSASRIRRTSRPSSIGSKAGRRAHSESASFETVSVPAWYDSCQKSKIFFQIMKDRMQLRSLP
jgi:hypothetical protein